MSPLLLSFVSGFVDAAVFVAMGGLFVAHVTGNFVLLGATVVGAEVAGHSATTSALQLISFPIFFAGAFLAARIARIRAGRSSTRLLLWITAAIIAAAAVPGLFVADAAAPQTMGFAFAMGVLNAAHRLDGSMGPPFTVMTGNVTGLAVRAAGVGAGQGKAGVTNIVLLVIAFALGCALGALGNQLIGLAAMLVPSALMALQLLIRR